MPRRRARMLRKAGTRPPWAWGRAILAALAVAGCGAGGGTGPGGPSGSLRIRTLSSGTASDRDGYLVAFDAGNPFHMDPNDLITVTGATSGDHSLELTGAAGNCTVAAPNPRTAVISPGSTTEEVFAVSCSPLPRPGRINVITVTTGLPPDPDGYTYSLDQTPVQFIGTNLSILIPSIPPGSHTVSLFDIATGCVVTSANPAEVVVSSDSTARVEFDVRCGTD